MILYSLIPVELAQEVLELVRASFKDFMEFRLGFERGWLFVNLGQGKGGNEQ